MITEPDVQEAIAELNGKRNPKRDDAILLAACYILQDHMFGQQSEQIATAQNYRAVAPAYSFASEPPEPYPQYSGAETVGDYGSSEFLQAIAGKDSAAMWAVMNELMDTLKMINTRVYNGVMRRIR